MASTHAKDDDFRDLLLTFAAGDTIVRAGQTDVQMYLVDSGRVELVKGAGPAERIVSTREAGDFFGELSALEEGAPHLTTARAATAVRVLPLDAAALGFIVRERPELALRILHRLALRLRTLDEETLRAHEIAAGPLAAERKPLPAADQVVAQATRRGGTALPDAALVHRDTGQRFRLTLDRRLLIGRFDPVTQSAPDIDLEIVDPQRTLSRRHASIWRDGASIYVREEPGVANGTALDDQSLAAEQPMRIRPGQTLRLGLVELELDLSPSKSTP
ncbi:MAG: cyclic nucleotide-binding domain-containing protein [Acidobacteriota bacterium]